MVEIIIGFILAIYISNINLKIKHLILIILFPASIIFLMIDMIGISLIYIFIKLGETIIFQKIRLLLNKDI